MTTPGTYPVPQGLRLIATDLDGTLIPHGGTISERTMAALSAAEAAGIHVVYVTGRPPRWLAPVVEVTGHTGYAIGANGAVVLDLAAGTIDIAGHIPAEAVLEIADRMRHAVPDAVLGIETVDDIRVEAGYEAARGGRTAEGLAPGLPANRHRENRVEDLLDDQPIIKMIAISPGSTPDELLSTGRDAIGDLASTTHSAKATAMIEIGPAGVTKASTLATLAAHLKVEAGQIISFGDMPNDLAMLRWAGLGYAMAGGHPEAIATADHLAPPALQDGVAQVLEPYLLSVGASRELLGAPER